MIEEYTYQISLQVALQALMLGWATLQKCRDLSLRELCCAYNRELLSNNLSLGSMVHDVFLTISILS